MQRRLLIFTFLLLWVIATSDAAYTVRVIYFQPTDAPAVAPITKIRGALEQTQKFYAEEMQKHKFGKKTFRLERDNTGKIVVHHVKGKQKANHYFNDTSCTLNAELPANMKNKNDIFLSFIGGLDGVASGVGDQRSTLPDLDGEIYLKSESGLETPPAVDVNGDGVLNVLDLVAVANAFE